MSERIWEVGILVILYLQQLGDWIIAPMRFFSFLGYEEFFLLVAPLIYWCLSAEAGLRAGLLLMTSGAVNDVLKVALHSPRPFWIDDRVRALTFESSFGAPSGHAQHAVVVWGGLAAAARRPWAWPAAVLLISLIGFSRMVLGVHFPADVFFGWLLGGLLLWTWMVFEPRVRSWSAAHSSGERLGAAFAASLAMILLSWLPRLALSSWTFPADWAQTAALAFPGEETINPLALAGVVSYAGTFFGLILGAIWIQARGGFNTAGGWWLRLARFPIGLLGVIVLWYGLGSLFPRGEFMLAFALRYLRYALIGLWVSGIAPAVFIRLSLAKPLEEGDPKTAFAS